MSSEATPVTEALLVAYGVLGAELCASADEIKRRYSELAGANDPERWPEGSRQHAEAAARMRQVRLAYGLIHDAPMREGVLSGAGSDEVRSGASTTGSTSWWSIDQSAAAETVLLMVCGAAIGLLLVVSLSFAQVPGFAIYCWLIPLVLAFGFTTVRRRGVLVVGLLMLLLVELAAGGGTISTSALFWILLQLRLWW